MKRMFAVGCALIGLAATAAEEQPIRATDRPMTKEEARFHALDTNNDRRLSLAEFQADATSQNEFAKLDTDADGFVSLAEFTARPMKRGSRP